MMEAGEARAEILSRIRQANRKASGSSAERVAYDLAWQSLPRDYVRAGALSTVLLLEMFAQRLEDYGAHLFHARTSELPDTIAQILAERRKLRVAAAKGFPCAWLPPAFAFEEDGGASALELDLYDGVLTGATVAIAATGTIVLQAAAGEGRRALSLVPDYHLCVVLRDQVVETVPEAFERLAATPCRATTFISGPSATADIEMTRIQGVHGPRVLDVVLADSRT